MSVFDREALDHILRWVQDGVVSRRQLLGMGATDSDIQRLLRRRDLTVSAPGVYVDHTGRPSRRQRDWIAVVACWPAALTHESALPLPLGEAIHLAVPLERRPKGMSGVVIHRTAGFETRVDSLRGPPAIRVEHAAIDVMSKRIARQDVAGAFTVLADVCQTRRTTPVRISATLASRDRVHGRPTISAMLSDLAGGACSVLERGYVMLVERPHALPRPHRQSASRATGRRTRKDVLYEEFAVVVELDGRAFHDNARARDLDAKRDLAELSIRDAVTVRLTYGLVFREPCWTAASVGKVLRDRGWLGVFRRCPSCPPDLPVP